MAKYIDKSVLVAEIEKRKKEAESNCGGYKSYDEHHCDNCTVGFYEEFLEILNTLEVKTVDLEQISKHYALNNSPWDDCMVEIQDAFKTGFELGLKTKRE